MITNHNNTTTYSDTMSAQQNTRSTICVYQIASAWTISPLQKKPSNTIMVENITKYKKHDRLCCQNINLHPDFFLQ